MAIFCVMTRTIFTEVSNWLTLNDKAIFQTVPYAAHFPPYATLLPNLFDAFINFDSNRSQRWTTAMDFSPSSHDFPAGLLLFFFLSPLFPFFFSWQDFASRFSDTWSIAVIYDLVKNGEIIYFRATWSTKALEKKPAMERLGGGAGGAQVDFRRAEKDQSWE